MRLLSLSFTLSILGALFLLLGALYIRAIKRLQFRASELRDLKKCLEGMSVDLASADAAIRNMQSSKDELMSALSHEMRTPLTCLSGYTQMMLESEFPRERQVTFLGIIFRETQRLNGLLTDFLEVRFFEATENVKLRPGRMEDVLRETFELFKNQEGPHRFVLDVAHPLPEVNLDARRIRQVLLNLMSNAVKYSPAGGTIRLSASVQGDRIVASVQDQGIGIPAEAIPKLFTKFFRVPGEQTDEIPGTGLGLAMVRECVRAHGGDTWVESFAGRGSTFYFSLLPLVPAGGASSADAWKNSGSRHATVG